MSKITDRLEKGKISLGTSFEFKLFLLLFLFIVGYTFFFKLKGSFQVKLWKWVCQITVTLSAML